MDTLIMIGAFLGIFAFFRTGSLASKIRKLERAELLREEGTESRDAGITKNILESYIGQEIGFDFYEDEAESDLYFKKDAKLVAVDEKWALVEIKSGGKMKQKLIRLSSLSGIETKAKD